MNEKNNCSVLHRACGTFDSNDICTALASLQPGAPPLSWVELRPGWAIDQNGHPIPEHQASMLYPFLRAGDTSWLPHDAVLDELRYFYPDGCVHFLQTDSMVRWAVWSDKSQPDWWHSADQSEEAQSQQLGKEESTRTSDKDVSVYTLSDLQRFFGRPVKRQGTDNADNRQAQVDAPEKLKLRSYSDEGIVTAWTLITEET